MLVTREERKEVTKVWLMCCASLIIAIVVFGLIATLTRNYMLATGIFVALFFGCFILLCYLVNQEEIKKDLENKRKIKQAKLEARHRQTGVGGSPGKVSCHVCGTRFVESLNYCTNCGAEIIKVIENDEEDN